MAAYKFAGCWQIFHIRVYVTVYLCVCVTMLSTYVSM